MSLKRDNPVPREAAIAGICVGVAAVAATTLTNASLAALFPRAPGIMPDRNIGIVALILNIATTLVVTVLVRALSIRTAAAPHG
jgi:solute:Na+ symporter, SSS family